ncbi:hypothetical protein [Frondihabitans cladoniiphilus]|uniref:Immunity protein 35 of polymorphic toxin system n=1 Tax=Frondihabitans cladoniiphilus TaxID=715785 RepID=A0ABP8VT87_9MICO
MPHIVYAGQKIAISSSQLVDVKDKLREAAEAGRSLDLTLVDADGRASWLFWTPGAPIVINDGDIPAPQQMAFPDLAALGFPGFPEPPQQRRVGF